MQRKVNMRLREWGYKFLKPILSLVFKFYYRPKVFGRENIPKSGPIILVGNHKHLMDQCMAIISTKRVIHYMAKKEYFDGKMAWFFKFTGVIPVDRSRKDERAKSLALSVLKSGGAIGLFPEGTRNKTENLLLPFKFGAVALAEKADATIVPFCITGDYKFRTKNLKIIIDKPFKIDKNEDLNTANIMLENRIRNLLLENSNS